MTPRVLASNVHVHTEDGTVILNAGDEFDEQYAEFVTNPACFVDGAEPDVDTDAAKAAVDAAAKAEADAKVQADADERAKAEADAKAKADADAKAKAEADAKGNGEAVDYGSLAFPDLQKYVKDVRGLSAAGNTATLIARLEADDRDKATAAAAGN